MTAKMKRLADFTLVPGTSDTQAALKAGYPRASAQAQASRVLKMPHVRRYLAERQAELQSKHNVTLDRVVQEFAAIGFSNMADYIQDDGSGRPAFRLVGDIGRDKMSVVTELTIDTREEYEGRGGEREKVATVDRVRFRLADKVNALTALGKHLGMFPREGGSGSGDDTTEAEVVITVRGGMNRPKGKKK